MLSRLANKIALAPINGQAIRTAATASGSKKDDYKDPWDNPERDYVNFPRRQNPEFTPPVRHHWIPESFFKAFHAKTGVTGPYMFTGGIITFLLSKEYWVVEHEFKAGIEFFVVFGLIVRYAGPHIRDAIDEFQAERENHVREIRAAEIDKQKAAIAAEEEAQFMASSYEELIAAKKEAVGLQLEAEYRSRLATAYDQVKKRLDYQLELGNVMRRVEQKHMVDWIISNVRKSITAKAEDEALKKCVADLKNLAKA